MNMYSLRRGKSPPYKGDTKGTMLKVLFGIDIPNKKKCEEVQKALFEREIDWYMNKKKIIHLESKELHIWENNIITQSDEPWAKYRNIPLYKAQTFLDNPNRILFKHNVGNVPIPTGTQILYWEV